MPKLIAMRCLALALLCVLPGCTSLRGWTRGILAPKPADADARVVGRVSASGTEPALGRAVVFLESVGGRQAGAGTPPPIVIKQRLGRFDPDFAVVAPGQPVQFANDDSVFHGVFSYSRPNQFEKRPFAPGQTRTVTFHHAGAVQIYSPIDGAMRGLIVVVPGCHHAIPDARGDFQLSSVPAGRYRLSLWSESRGATTREVSLSPGEVVRADLTAPATRSVERPSRRSTTQR